MHPARPTSVELSAEPHETSAIRPSAGGRAGLVALLLALAPACGVGGPDGRTACQGDSCQELERSLSSPKADYTPADENLACRLGFYAACPAAECVADEGKPLPAPEAACTQWREFSGCASCEYYRCRERFAGCGADGYLLGYVGKYCDRYATVTEPRVSERAAVWLQDVRACLIDELEEGAAYDAPCDEIRTVGVDSHSRCYVRAGFCGLSLGDWMAIVHTVDVGDIPLGSLLETAGGCLNEWTGGRTESDP